MRSGKKIKQRVLLVDPQYNSLLITRLTNKVMMRGQKETARNLVYHALQRVAEKTKKDALVVFEQAIEKAGPKMELVSRRIGGATYQIPVETTKTRSETLAMRWLIQFSRQGKGQSFSEKLAQEIINAFNEEGPVIKKRDDTHKMAEANRAFAHFARF